MLGVDDELLKRPKRSIPRADVAELAVQSLVVSEAENRYAHGLSPFRAFPSALWLRLHWCGNLLEASPLRSVQLECFVSCRSIDAISKEPGDGKPTRDFAALFGGLQGDCKYGPGSVKPAAKR